MEELSFQIKKIDIVESCVLAPKVPLTKNAIFQFNTSVNPQWNQKIGLILACGVEVKDEENKVLLGNVRTLFTFTLQGVKTKIDKDTIVLPDEFLSTIVSISISTLRGILFSQFRGTYLQNAVMPIIDPKLFNFAKTKIKASTT